MCAGPTTPAWLQRAGLGAALNELIPRTRRIDPVSCGGGSKNQDPPYDYDRSLCRPGPVRRSRLIDRKAVEESGPAGADELRLTAVGGRVRGTSMPCPWQRSTSPTRPTLLARASRSVFKLRPWL